MNKEGGEVRWRTGRRGLAAKEKKYVAKFCIRKHRVATAGKEKQQ